MNLAREVCLLADKYLCIEEGVNYSLDKWLFLDFGDRRYFFNDYRNIFCVLNFSWKSKLQFFVANKFNKRTEVFVGTVDKILFFKTLNGYSFFNLSKGLVLKLTEFKYEPNFLFNFQTAYQSLPNNVSKIKKSGTRGKYCYVVSELISNTKKISWKKWCKVLPQITHLIKKLFFSTSPETISANIYAKEILEKMYKDKIGKKNLNKEYTEIIGLIEQCIKKYSVNDCLLYRTFTHGDLVPNNVLVSASEYYIVDWDNAGYQNILYDLFIQDFYYVDKPVWREFDKANFISNPSELFFFGWVDEYIKMVNNGLGVTLTNEQIKVSLIICLSEIARKSYLRYQSFENSDNGKKMLDIVISHCRSILN